MVMKAMGRSDSPWIKFWGASLFGVLSMGVPALVAGSNTPSDLHFALVITVVITVVSAGGLAQAFVTGEANLMWLGFWMYTYLFLGVAAFVQISRNSFPLAGSVEHPAVTVAAILSLGGCVAWVIGYQVMRTRRGLLSARVVGEPRRRTFVAIAVLVTVAYIAVLGINALFSSRLEIANYALVALGSQTNVNIVSALGVVPIAIAFFAQLERLHRGGGSRFTLFVLLVLNLIVSNLFTSARAWVATLVLAFVVMVGSNPANFRRIRTLTAGWIFSFLIVFPQVDEFFRNKQNGRIFRLSPADSLATGDYDSFNQIIHGISYVDSVGIQMGRQLLGSFFFFVPRSIWLDKAQGTGVILGEFAQLSFTNLSAPLWIEGYVDFGVIGTAMIMAIWGLACGALDRRFVADLQRGYGVFRIGVPMLAFWQIVILRGSLIAVMGNVLVITLCMVFLGWGSTRPEEFDSVSGTGRRSDLMI